MQSYEEIILYLFKVHQVQSSMQSKGGYDHAQSGITSTPTGKDLSVKDNHTTSYNTSSPGQVHLQIDLNHKEDQRREEETQPFT